MGDIEGGDRSRGVAPAVPVGLEQLLRLAAADITFRELLTERRGAAADAAGVVLTPSERAILESVGEAQLGDMVDHVPPPASDRRGFLQGAAASAVVALGGAALSSCESCDRAVGPGTPGSQPDMPPRLSPSEGTYRHVYPEGTAAGIQPDVPPRRPETPVEPPEPPPRSEAPHQRPDVREAASGGGAAPDMPIGIGGLRSTEE